MQRFLDDANVLQSGSPKNRPKLWAVGQPNKEGEMSEVREVIIRSESDALAVLEQALNGVLSEEDSYLIKFDGWPLFELDVEGVRYHSTVTTPLMKGLLEYQQVINRIFADSVYSKGARALTEEDRSALELTFSVAEGSSDIQAYLQETFNKLGEKMIDKMTGGQIVITVVGLALVAALYFGHQHQVDNQLALAVETNRSSLEARLVESNQKMAAALADTNQALIAIVKSTPDATKVTAGNAVFDRDQIVQLNQKEREVTTPSRIDGNYYVTSIKSAGDKWRLDVVKVGTEDAIKVDLFKGQHAANGIGEIMSSFIGETPIFLHALARVKDGKVISASILGTTATGLPPASDFYALHGQIDSGYAPDTE